MEQSSEFVGPFKSWTNVKSKFGAIGDGVADDTIALQRAIDSLSASTPVLWLPAGTYRISSPLTVKHKFGFSIIGEDPANTRLFWSGKQVDAMLQTDQSSTFKISRLTFDGDNVADWAINVDNLTHSAGGYYSTFNEISDLHLVKLNDGIHLTIDAETTVERVFFEKLPGYGLKVGDWNTLNIFLNDSLFLECGTGVSNWDESGNFIVSNSVFVRSATADMSIGNTGYFTSRHNLSIAPKAVFIAAPIGLNPAQITIQNDTILDPVDTPFQIGNLGPLMLLDNVIRMQDSHAPVVLAFFDPGAAKNIFSAGNTLTTDSGPKTDASTSFFGTFISYDDVVVAPTSIPDIAPPTSVYTPPNLHRTIFDVPRNASDVDIQAAINNAAASGLPHPVVHIPAGDYQLFNSLIVPLFSSDLEITGDDVVNTTLYWEAQFSGPMLTVLNSTASLRDLHLKGDRGPKGDGIVIPIVDQPLSNVVVDQALLQGDNDYSIRFEGIEHANIELLSVYTAGAVTGIDVTAGAYRAAGLATLGRTNAYTGSMQSSATSTSFDVRKHGKFMAQDNWHDLGQSGPRNFVLTDSGTVTEQSGAIGVSSDTPFELDGFDGQVNLIGLQFNGGFQNKSGKGKTRLMTLGLCSFDQNYLPSASSSLDITNTLDDYLTLGQGAFHLPTTKLPDAQAVRSMLAQTRSEYPSIRLPMSSEGSRTRLSRISVQGVSSAIRFFPRYPAATGQGNPLNYLGYRLETTKGPLTSCPAPAAGANASFALEWWLQDAGDGDFLLMNGNGQALDLIGNTSGDSQIGFSDVSSVDSQRWIVQDVGDGRRYIINRATGLRLSRGDQTCLELSHAEGSDSTKWLFKTL